jgi:hypothetical protein
MKNVLFFCIVLKMIILLNGQSLIQSQNFIFGANDVFNFFLIFKYGQSLYGDGRCPPSVPIPQSTINKVYAGGTHSMLIDEYNHVYSFGSNDVI